MRKGIFLLCFLLLLSSSLFAHRVNVFAYKEGGKICLEGYFSDGTPARNSKIEVYNPEGKKILEGKTDEKGEFSFPIPGEKGNLKIVLLASMGHRGETSISVGGNVPVPAGEGKKIDAGKLGDRDIERMVEGAVEKAMKPVIKMIEEENRRVRLTDILGGIGYILGLAGVALYFLSKRKK
ncbi:MAG: hypothetical protein GXO71_01640 [Caldiserica bacterium]|nr:hypothetical protein [Caldisericota bacterium]